MPLGLMDKMQASEAEAEQSSSSISSPPVSPQNHSDTIRVAQPLLLREGVARISAEAVNASAAAANGHTSTTAASASTNSTGNSAPDKPKRPRKKKEVKVGADGRPVVEEKVKKPRKPREPKDKAATATASAATQPRKRVKTEPKPDENLKLPHDAASQATRQSTITEMVGAFSHPPQAPASAPAPSQQHRNSDGMIRNDLLVAASHSSTPRPISSGQNYDPIRGSTMEVRRSLPPNGAILPQQASQMINRASASPSIASLIDPPSAFKAPTPLSSFTSQTNTQQSSRQSQQSPPPIQLNTAPGPRPAQPSPPVTATHPVTSHDGAMDLDTVVHTPSRAIPEIKAPSKSTSPAPTPPKAAARPTPPKGTGSGLLSSSDLFGGPSTATDQSERKGVNIDIQIPLNRAGGNTINIAQEIIKKYGRDAINPRAAAHREQLLRIAAEQERLGGVSNDEMSVDLMSEMEGDSNVEMGGMDDEKSNHTGGDMEAGGKPQPKKRRRKVEEYDKEDDFIDDTELAWQEGAAVAKDGFFVYSGPLVPAGQQAQVESTTTSTRGTRGRGRGRGGRSAAAAGGGTTHASLAEKTRDPPAAAASTTTTTTRGRGTRGRGTGAPRKPRITKAEKEKMEVEKAERAREAANLNTNHSTNPASTAASPNAAPPRQQFSLAPPTATPPGPTLHQQQLQHQQVTLSMQPPPPQHVQTAQAVGSRT